MSRLYGLALLLLACSGTLYGQSMASRTPALRGNYRGFVPCPDCRYLEEKLTIDCTAPCLTGTYNAHLVYPNDTNGNIIRRQRGTWKVTENSTGAELMIVLNDDKKRGESGSYYYVKQTGALQPLDKNLQPISNPMFDQTLQKSK